MRVLLTMAFGMTALLASPGASRADEDPFGEGTAWKGEYDVAGKKGEGDWLLQVTERKAGTFKGEVTIRFGDGTKETYKAEGKAPAKGNGAVSFKTERKGFFQVTVTGRLNNGETALVFRGQGKMGKNLVGTATLKPVVKD